MIYLAGGCFWGIEKLMQSIPGVTDTESGYANGTGSSDAHYNIVTSGKTGFKETVRVEYDPEKDVYKRQPLSLRMVSGTAA